MSSPSAQFTAALADFSRKAKQIEKIIWSPELKELLQRLAQETTTLQTTAKGPDALQQGLAGLGAFDAFLKQIKRCDDWLSLGVHQEKQRLLTTIRQTEEVLAEWRQKHAGLRPPEHKGIVRRILSMKKPQDESAFYAEKTFLEKGIARLSTTLATAGEALHHLENEEQHVLSQLRQVNLETHVWQWSTTRHSLLNRGFLVGDGWSCPATGMKFMWVPGGLFQIGDLFGEENRKEHPVHTVRVDGFWMGQYPVTQGEWQQVMDTNPSHFKLGNRHPVENISWQETQAFLQRLNAQCDGKYRLPTEAEWEYACRSGGKKEAYAGGDPPGRVAWFGNMQGSTHPVGQKSPNGLGIYDMSGNVSEWVQDSWTEYSPAAQINPLHENDPSRRVNRGGSWFACAQYVRCSHRTANTPEFRSHALGVRLVRGGDYQSAAPP